MKKAISLFLSIIMVITAFGGADFSAYAEEHKIIGEINCGDSINISTVNLFRRKLVYYAFTPDSDGTYLISMKNGDCAVLFSLYDSDFNAIDDSYYKAHKDYTGAPSLFDAEIVYDDFTAGSTYYIGVYITDAYTTVVNPSVLKLEAHTHSYEFKQTNPPLCVEDGYDLYICSSCGSNEKRNVQPATGEHDMIVKTIKPTCQREGYDSVRCRNCSFSYKENIVPISNEHDLIVTTIKPTCQREGYDSVRCRNCSLSYIENIVPVSNDHYLTVTTIQPNCQREGYDLVYCRLCSFSYKENIVLDKDAHQFVNGICRLCGTKDESYIDEIIDLSSQELHTCAGKYGGEIFKFSFTPEKTAYYKFNVKSKYLYSVASVIKCDDEVLYETKSGELNICLELEQGREYQLELTNKEADMQIGVSISEHTHSLSTTKKPASCSKYGYTRYRCTNTYCRYDETKYIEPTGDHQIKKTVHEPTCTSEGYTEYECTGCNLYYLSNYVAPDSSKHNAVNGVCEECYEIVDRNTINELVLDDTVNAVVPYNSTASFLFTPEKTDYYRFYSSGAGIDSYAILFDMLGNEIAFDDDSGSVKNNFEIINYLVAGKSYLLVVGAYSKSKANVSVPVTASIHTHSMTSRTVKADCEAKGYVAEGCDCGYEVVESVTPALGHRYKKDYVVKPTCTEGGYTVYYCERCYDSYEAYPTAPTGVHNYKNGICENCFERKHNSNVTFMGELNAGERISVDYSSKDCVSVFTFTPNKSGTYLFKVSGYCNSWAGLYDDKGKLLCEEEDTIYNSDAVISYELTAGKTYTYKVEQADSEKGSYFISVELHTHSFTAFAIPANCISEGITTYTCEQCYYQYMTVQNATGVHSYSNGFCIYCDAIERTAPFDSIAPNSTAVVPMETGTVLRFVPTETKNYVISCKTDGNPQAAVLDESANVLYMDDDGGEKKDFRITAYLEAGKCYYIVATGISKDYELSVFEKNYCLHNYLLTKSIEPSCTEEGYQFYTCTECGGWMIEPVEETAHTYKSTTTKATTSKNGSVVTKCSVCGAKKPNTTIYYPKTITLSTTSYTYNGKVKTPSVTVKDSKGKTLKKNTDYTVTYAKGRKSVGKYSVTIKFKGNYSGTVTKTFTIKPKGTSLSKVTADKKKFTVKWKKQATQTTGYQIQYSTSSKFTSKTTKTVTISKNKTTSKTISKLKAKKKYYVRVRTYKTVKINGKNTKLYSSWSKATAVTTKK